MHPHHQCKRLRFAERFPIIVLINTGEIIFVKPTIKNIADKAGVSTATVSRALAYKDDILKPATAKRIRQIAREMGYHKNVAASQLASRNNNTIAVIINYNQTSFWNGIINGITQRAHELKHKVIIFSAGINDTQRLTDTIDEALEHQANGILVISSKIAHDQLAILNQANVPYRLISIYDQHHPEQRFISSDNVAIGEMATNYLIKHGHQKIGIIGIDHSLTGQQRLFGYQKAMTAARLTINPQWIHYGDYSYQCGQQLFNELTADHLTAVVAGSDMVGAGLIKQAVQTGIKIPDQLSIVSIDGSITSEITTPALTSVSQDFYQMGVKSVDNLLNDAPSLFIPSKIVERASVKTIN